jgi:hypothetical protein
VAESSKPVSPFNPPVTQVPRGGPGCGKPLLIGCGVLLLLLAAGLVTLAVEWRTVLRGYFQVLEASLAPRLPADLTAAERDRLHRAFAGAASFDAADETRLPALQRLQRKVVLLSGSQAPLSHRDVQELAENLEALHRPPPGAPGVPPSAVPGLPPAAAAPGAAPPAAVPGSPPPSAAPGSPPSAGPPNSPGTSPPAAAAPGSPPLSPRA